MIRFERHENRLRSLVTTYDICDRFILKAASQGREVFRSESYLIVSRDEQFNKVINFLRFDINKTGER